MSQPTELLELFRMGLKGFCNHVTLLHNVFWQDKAKVLKRTSHHDSDNLFCLRYLFAGWHAQTHLIKWGWLLDTFFYDQRLRLERGFIRKKVLRTAIKKLTLVISFAADWQTFLDIRSSSFCMRDVVSVEQESITAQIRLPIQIREVNCFPLSPSNHR